MTTETDHYDVIVIGSGAGGGTRTHALLRDLRRIAQRGLDESRPSEVGLPEQVSGPNIAAVPR